LDGLEMCVRKKKTNKVWGTNRGKPKTNQDVKKNGDSTAPTEKKNKQTYWKHEALPTKGNWAAGVGIV